MNTYDALNMITIGVDRLIDENKALRNIVMDQIRDPAHACTCRACQSARSLVSSSDLGSPDIVEPSDKAEKGQG